MKPALLRFIYCALSIAYSKLKRLQKATATVKGLGMFSGSSKTQWLTQKRKDRKNAVVDMAHHFLKAMKEEI